MREVSCLMHTPFALTRNDYGRTSQGPSRRIQRRRSNTYRPGTMVEFSMGSEARCLYQVFTLLPQSLTKGPDLGCAPEHPNAGCKCARGRYTWSVGRALGRYSAFNGSPRATLAGRCSAEFERHQTFPPLFLARRMGFSTTVLNRSSATRGGN